MKKSTAIPIRFAVSAHIDTESLPGEIFVRSQWSSDAPLDRTDGVGWVVKDPKIADRLVRAIEAGVVFKNAKIVLDAHGKSFVTAPATVLGRTLNADLRRLGF